MQNYFAYNSEQDWFDSFIETMKNAKEQGLIRDDAERNAMVNPRGVQKVLDAYGLLKQATTGVDVSVTYDLHNPTKQYGRVTVKGDVVDFCDTDALIEVMLMCRSFSVYPEITGKIVWIFDFDDVARYMD